MTTDDATVFAREMAPELPSGWGWLTYQPEVGPLLLVVEEIPDGWMVWLAKAIAGGRILKGSVKFGARDSREDFEMRAWLVLGLLRRQELVDAARWN